MTSVPPGPPLRIAVLANFESIHARRWLDVFVSRGHEVHAISYYHPSADLPGATVHVLSGARSDGASAPSAAAAPAAARSLAARLPPSLLRLLHAWRYRRAGLRRVLDALEPHVFHAHYVTEHCFYGAFAGYHPYVESAWGSDLLRDAQSPLGRRLAAWALRRADLLIANDASLARRATELGIAEERVRVLHLGADAAFLEAGAGSVNLSGAEGPPVIVSLRALEPLYNLDVLLRAFARLRRAQPAARLLLANDGSQRRRLEALARDLEIESVVQFCGPLSPAELPALLAAAHVYVSVPSSDSFAVSNLEAMAAGAFPVLAALPSVEGWVEDGAGGFLVPPRDVDALAEALAAACLDAPLRRRAARLNRARVQARGLHEANMLLVERLYYRLAGHPIDTSI